jgi:histidine ammonia-lyase
MKTLELGNHPLSVEEVLQVVDQFRKVKLSRGARERLVQGQAWLQKHLSSGQTYYSLNTGFGSLAEKRIHSKDLAALQLNLLRSHAVGIGDPIEDRAVRAMLLLRANTLIQGFSGVRWQVVEQLLELLNRRIHPVIPEFGSVGASGDLAPLAHLALPLIGEGRVRFRGRIEASREVLKRVGLPALTLGPKEGLALINGTQFMSALGVLSLWESEYLADVADVAGALSVEALRGTADAFDPRISALRPHSGQMESARRVRQLLLEGGKSPIARSHANCGKVQDPYSLRCISQVHGATRDALSYVRKVLEVEINSVTDNPLVFEDGVISGGNFHGQPVAMALDFMTIALSELASISEQRMSKLVNSVFSGLPPFLVEDSGLHSGFMIVQYAAASLVSANKTLAHPAVVDSIPTSADKEDHVSMGAWGAVKCTQVVKNVRRVLGMELMAAAQGVDLLKPLTPSRRLKAIHQAIRKQVKFLKVDRILHDDLVSMEVWLQNHGLSVAIPAHPRSLKRSS